MEEKLKNKLEKLNKETEELREKYEKKKDERDFTQTLLYCKGPGGILLENTTVSDKALKDPRFSIHGRGKLYIHTKSPVNKQGDADNWELDPDHENNEIIIKEDSNDEDSWDNMEDEGKTHYKMSESPYRLAIPKFTNQQLDEMSEPYMKIVGNMAVSKLDFPILLVKVTDSDNSSESKEKEKEKEKSKGESKKKDKKKKDKKKKSDDISVMNTEELNTLPPSKQMNPQNIKDKLANLRAKK